MNTALVYPSWLSDYGCQTVFLKTNNDSHVQSMIVILECIFSDDYTG